MMKPTMGMNVMGNEIPFERSMLIDLALVAMDELIKMAQADAPLWIKSNGGKEKTNLILKILEKETH